MILTPLPKGIALRRLDNSRRAKNSIRSYKFSGIRNDGRKTVYGNTVRSIVKQLS